VNLQQKIIRKLEDKTKDSDEWMTTTDLYKAFDKEHARGSITRGMESIRKYVDDIDYKICMDGGPCYKYTYNENTEDKTKRQEQATI